MDILECGKKEEKERVKNLFLIEKVPKLKHTFYNSTQNDKSKRKRFNNIKHNYLKKIKSKRLIKRRPCRTRVPWTKEEDRNLLELFEHYGMMWTKISNKMRGRTPSQVRERYLNVLDPSLSKQPFTINEDILIYDLHLLFENSWKEYRKYLPGRSSDNIKSRYYSSIKGNELIIKICKSL